MSDFRELLIGCGHSRVKKVASVDGNPHWRGLVTLDGNESCLPDIVVNLNERHWGYAKWNREPNVGARYYFEPNQFDEVHAYEILEHLGQQGDAESFFATFTQIWHVLKPNGHLYATVPSRYSPWLWGDPSHCRAILPESIVFLDQSEYIRQLDGPNKTAMSDFRSIYQADFHPARLLDNRETFQFILRAVKPSRYKRDEE